jgi:hypothetical protein
VLGELPGAEGRVVREDARHRAMEFLKERYAVGEVDAGRFDTGVADLLAAQTEAELAGVVRSLPPPVALTSMDRRLAKPLEIHSGTGRLRLEGRWQVARQTHVSADLGSVRIDLTEAEFDDHITDLHVYTGWGSITIIVPRRCRGSDHPPQRRSRLAAGTARARAPACPARRDHQHRQSPPSSPRNPGPQEPPTGRLDPLTTSPAAAFTRPAPTDDLRPAAHTDDRMNSAAVAFSLVRTAASGLGRVQRESARSQSAMWQIDCLLIASVGPHTGYGVRRRAVAMVVMIFLVGTLLGLLGGAIVCMRYLRQEMTANVSPKLKLIQLHLDNLEAEVNLALATRVVDLHRNHDEQRPPPN